MVDIGDITRGTVVRVLPYGALVRLDDGCTGLVHISEIDTRFVRDVADYLEPEDRVVVKVLALKDGGKLEFSIKQAHGARAEMGEDPSPDDFHTPTEAATAPAYHEPVRRDPRAAFDDKMREFLADSSDRLTDFRRHQDIRLCKHRR